MSERRHDREAHHVVPHEIGGRARRSPNLRTLAPQPLELPEDWELRDGVPASRAECGSGPRPCPYSQCRHHLWLVEAESRPGRRHQNGGAPATELRPTTQATCALDVAASVPRGEVMTFGDVGELLGIGDEGARKIYESAMKRLRSLGYTQDELEAMLSKVATMYEGA